MTLNLIGRPVEDHEAEAFLTLYRQVFAPRFIAESVIQTLQEQSSWHAWFFLMDRHPVGFVLWQAWSGGVEVLDWGIHPDQRRLGLGRRALQLFLQEVQRQDPQLQTVDLEVRADNHGAVHLYQQMEWQAVGVRRGYYSDGCDAVLYRWQPDKSASSR